MPKPDSSEAPSLLPYLKRQRSGIFLKLNLPETVSSAGEAGGTFSIMRSGRIVLDGHEPLVEVVVLTQADTYRFKASELNPITNSDVEKNWQAAWDKIKAARDVENQERGCLVPPSQLGPDGDLIALKPLFYCRHVDRYAHALCPFCGGQLALCQQDDALEQAGLPAYSGSLQRYLYCPDCHRDSEQAPYYQYLHTDEAPECVQDCDALMADFSRLLAKTDLAADLPCIGCKEAAACYGSETLVLKRMTAVQFYPFHLLLMKAPSLNALDFLSLLAGATEEELERVLTRDQKYNRLQLVKKMGIDLPGVSGFLFAGEPRFFLEVLYLKLSFLQALLGLMSTDCGLPIDRLSLEALGVRLAATGSRLPFFWNFELTLIDPVGQPAGHPMGKAVSRDLAMEQMANAWFYVLLVNARQSMAAVHEVMDALRREPAAEQGALPAFTNPALAPGNIYWQPAELDLQGAWQAFWRKTLELGVQVLQSSTDTGSNLTLQEIDGQLSELKALVRQDLFQEQSGSAAESSAGGRSTDSEIERILTALLSRWTAVSPAPAEAVEAGSPEEQIAMADIVPNEDGDFEETVILSAGEDSVDESGDSSAEPALEKTVLISPQPDAGNDLAKTVVIKPPSPGDRTVDPDKTVVLSTPSEQAPDGDLAETIVSGQSQGKRIVTALEKTVALKPGRQKPSPPGNESAEPSASRSDNDLDATIIQSPKSGKDRKPKP